MRNLKCIILSSLLISPFISPPPPSQSSSRSSSSSSSSSSLYTFYEYRETQVVDVNKVLKAYGQ
eukprot:CAMPEP_0185256110 /NCGR_PEP_ID=MMETSP1359-20130426/5185_1 /TAXON_ID=552665 /ORGANISM="Bigelowiella longifila, Strain CCMP242" /LENGTH=63 /DNA_ID=CAMNT_0027840473 /DNA_START=67 /DNA_END=255 /DNA_ORIENTATION=+